jgi:hypothetical protein
MARGKADLSNMAIRIFLHRVGIAYDTARGYSPFKANGPEWAQVLLYFDNKCCYCNRPLENKAIVQDHLIPINKKSLGLHAWGNVVPACAACNSVKHDREWTDFLEEICDPKDYLPVMKRIKGFMQRYAYVQSKELGLIAVNLYEDIGAVCMTLIDLRYKQAQELIDSQVYAATTKEKNR